MTGTVLRGFRSAFDGTFRAIFADRAVVTVMVGAVILYSFFYPMGYRQQVASEQPVVIVDQDRTPLSRELIRHIQRVNAVHVIAIVESEAEAAAQVAAMRAEGFAVITSGFERDILRGNPGPIALYGNGAFLGRTNRVLTGLGDAIGGFAHEAAIRQAAFAGAATPPPFHLVQRPLFNTREGYGSAVVTGVAELIIQQTLLIGIAVMAGTRRERKGRLFFSAPQLMGIATACVLVGLINMLYYAGFMFWYQDYPLGGNLAGLLLGGLLFIGAVVAFGLFLASFFRTRERAYPLILVTSLPLFFLSNLSWPATATPGWLVWLAKLIPSTPGINVMVKFNQLGASFTEAAPEIVNLLVLIIVFGALAWWRYRRPGTTSPRSIE
ncbi:ABC transporter permease [Cellvibrio japonicus]|uniref:ABC-2 type transporter domain protein n=1 Tax=Cellvibrio japonicus (strain Ueda107) TaxID=498211 RepID=B3PDY7_CELJU|nr:ABC transporter permease [Cellvibrio japonicus]ACE84845.1 ABC-2 type transporter domain protein [Cellvibrio japonicus Ueda107]QEI13471.1 ABC transporter permease [Cellvibrio japonicus]QEI17045.1 ABC transporter permease [Cellvibrio japonicus]QEI20623.1 ABC transporter permease [Cellvibrio japonicus]